MKQRYTIISLLLFLVTIVAQAQISIGGNVYGGGNAGNTSDQTKVTVRAGDIHGAVFGGARQANVGGSAFVHIDGENMSGDITVNAVYGGNDIAGTIGTSATLPHASFGTDGGHSVSDYNTFILTTPEKKVTGEGGTTTQPHSIFIGQVYGGSNGDYDYTTTTSAYYGMQKPEVAKAFVDIHGGTFGYVYGGGNAVTVTDAVDICINNTSTVTTSSNDLKLTYAESGSTNGVTKLEDITTASLDNPNDLRLLEMGINLSTYEPGFNFLRVFGGNNKAPMHIRPTWHLQSGSIVNLYSGGNEGKMTSPEGLLLEIPATSDIIVENVFGGCRKADVFPTRDVEGTQKVTTVPKLSGYYFPQDLAARVLVRGGDVKNVYGGNDISGKVYFGNAVGVYASIRGDVYGGGNGSYAYTDNSDLADDTIWGDFYYNPGTNSVAALNDFRPNAEQVSLRVAGTSADNPTIIGGGIYVGGNCATLRPEASSSIAELKIGSYVIADKVFLGNNGEKMVDTDILARYAGSVTTASRLTKDFSTLDLTDKTTAGVFAAYMNGVSMETKPSVVFDNSDKEDPATYIDYTSYFGSFYCGGNIGSIKYEGSNTIDFDHKVVIFDKLVGGSNQAYVNPKYDANNNQLNAAYEGGIIGDPDDVTGNKLVLNLSGLKIQPMRWILAADPQPTAETNFPFNRLTWNTVDANGDPTPPVLSGLPANANHEAEYADLNRRFENGNIYGGCCESGIVNGNVVINLNGTIIDRDILFDEVESDELGEEISLYGEDQSKQATFKITKRRTGVILAQQGMDVLGKALNVFGGGKGKGTEIWGSTTVNLKKGYTFQIFGGSEQGVIGRSLESQEKTVTTSDYAFNGKHYAFDPAYSCYVNLCGENDGVTKKANSTESMAECEFMYGGGFEGPIAGNTVINLGKGRIFNSFAGSCNADILGHTETYVGRMVKKSDKPAENYIEQMGYLGSTKAAGSSAYMISDEEYYVKGFPWVRDIVYGGNDLGGEIKGAVSFKNRVRTGVRNMVHKYNDSSADGADVLVANAYVEYLQGRANALFGGCYGTYDYTLPKFATTIAKPGFTKPLMNNAFVNFRPTETHENNMVGKVYGAGQGQTGETNRDKLQNRSYVLVDVPADMTYYNTTEVFGAGAWGGVGMGVAEATYNADKDKGSAIIDLMCGKIGAAYGASYKEGVTRRTLVNVPSGSTIEIGSIFGGAYGTETLLPCDVYEANVEYHSADAWLVYSPERTVTQTDPVTEEVTTKKLGDERMKGAIYGGNNRERRTIYSKITIDVPVNLNHCYYGTTKGYVYGAGYGERTWAEYTEINLNDGADVYEVYGGGEAGRVLNAESVQAYMNNYWGTEGASSVTDPKWKAAWTLGGGLDPETFTFSATSTSYLNNAKTNLTNALARTAEVDDRLVKTYKYNTNVLIRKGATVENYAYGGGLGVAGIAGSGDVYGSTYIALLGGKVKKDLYAAGKRGGVYDAFGKKDFIATANAYVCGGTVRNAYGGGYMGSVGYHEGAISAATTNDIDGETHVVIGIRKDQTDANKLLALQKVKSNATLADYGFYIGVPTVQRNAYGGGEGETQKGGQGGAVYGTANLTLNNGYIGYVFLHKDETFNAKNEIIKTTTITEDRYEEKLTDETYYDDEGNWAGTNRLRDCGNIFGGGYSDRSNVDHTNVTMWGGIVRNSLHGGAEIAAVGRGSTREGGVDNATRVFEGIYKAGGTKVTMYNGHVKRNVFGGGKGYNILGYGGANELYTDGYVFGSTEVYIHGGEIGTAEGVEVQEDQTGGYGNVFGGGDIGYVYSPSITSPKTIQNIATGSPGHRYYYDDAGKLTEDCKVVISPYLQVKDPNGIEINGHTHPMYDYVETEDLNHLPKKNSNGAFDGKWLSLDTGDDCGIIIHNAVFGGGNVTTNASLYADLPTVYGNTTATLNDVYHRDFITIGTEHIGGIYGGGNRSLVDGYRELNITNYGTDYYGLKQTISIDEYRGLSNRERAYFQLEYKCIANNTVEGQEKKGIVFDRFYYNGEKLKEEEYLKLLNLYDDTEDLTEYNLVKSSFEPYGFCSIYAGRLLNTIQRADFCGVYGSRMVLQGAKDRVADVGEDIDYTINRVGELSLNLQHSVISESETKDQTHGNYFGIYSLVNYLGNLTSDKRFGADMQLDEAGGDVYSWVDAEGNLVNYEEEEGKTPPAGYKKVKETYYSWKKRRAALNTRNKGVSHNEVALASGVFLELLLESSTPTNKEYGYVTGIVELDLINVRKDQVGGGFVYAKNEHRVPMYYTKKENVLLSAYNRPPSDGGVAYDEARTYRRYRYATPAQETADGLTVHDPQWADSEWPSSGGEVISGDVDNVYKTMTFQTSGNFIHHEKRIVDDCYPMNNSYIIGSANFSEAHYWYVKGDVYIYDQKLSAYTGSANAYSKEVHLPLTITAASNGKLQLLNVKPNLYAYFTDKDGRKVKIGTEVGSDGKPIDKVTVNNESDTYKLNDVISWWDWHQMSARDRQYFVPQTYVNCVTVTITENNVPTEYAPGTYVMDETDYGTFNTKFTNHTITIKDAKGVDVETVSEVFRSSNNIGHESGYVLTFDMNSPKVWDDYYTSVDGSAPKKSKADYEDLFTSNMNDSEKQNIINAWREGPTFTPTTGGVYGKRQYKIGDVITEETYKNAAEGKEKMERAYVAKETVSYTYSDTPKTVNPGTPIPWSEWTTLGDLKDKFAEAWFCKTTLKLNNENYLLYGELKYQAEIDNLKTTYSSLATDIESSLTPAYICTDDGEYGGQQFDYGKNYSAIEAWCSLSNTDRQKFRYNYDALDLLTNSAYLTVNPNVTSSPDHSATETAFHSPYTDQVSVEYRAVFVGGKDVTSLTLTNAEHGVNKQLNTSQTIDQRTIEREVYEKIRNDKRHYTHVTTKSADEVVYIANNNFIHLGVPYGKGQIVDYDIYSANNHDVDPVTFETPGERYYCFERYQKADNTWVEVGSISPTDFKDETKVPNYQQYFVIQGKEPTETTTLYVSRESNAHDVMKEKIISVVYQYTYYEDGDDGGATMTNELHVINIHLQLESGAPTIGELTPPPTVLPGTAVGLSLPDVNPGLYEVLNSGWELFATPDDAVNHRNGVPFTNNGTKVYWYQNQKNWVAFYSRTWLGKTYSNSVPLSVANFHDLDEVMQDKEHHMYVDRTDVDRECKIYIDNRNCVSDPAKSELDLLKDFYDLSLQSTKITTEGAATKDHETLNNHVRAGRNLEFILRSNISPKKYTPWEPIGNDNSKDAATGQCFQGNLHGDGYTISGLSKSLFGHLCGEVYNLGVTGSFTGAGIAETGDGYLENCWVKTTGTPVKTSGETHYAVFGNPSRAAGDERGQVQVENCYYPESNDYQVPTATDYAHGKPRQMEDKDFYNGTVAYNLNGFYLKKRYYHGTGLTVGTEYKYLQPNADGTLPDVMSTGHYPSSYAIYQPHIKMSDEETVPYKGTNAPYMGYVENRFYDGDYRYAGSGSNDIRMRVVTTTTGTGDDAVEKSTTYFVPIWPDDYIFFGQSLNYDYGGVHQANPSHINKNNERIDASADGNRVYRAPAYFRSKEMKVAHFNPTAVFAETKKNDANVIAYKGMTAIDFSGGNGDVADGYKEKWNGNYFYQPLLDDDGLTSFKNEDLTQNLLVYTMTSTSASAKTNGVVKRDLTDYAYEETNQTYHNVAPWDKHVNVRGHWVQKIGNAYVAPNDHLLVDCQDFNCPIGYSFKASTDTEDGSRMWYQREPDNFVDGNKGWETVSIPFEAKMVTTSSKGEITHFYGESTTGHEYWLREYQPGGSVVDNILKAKFAKPKADPAAETKYYSNTFLWDYYYSKDDQQDYNEDIYKTYYQESKSYPQYPRVGAGVPYLIGFPGKNYYEFDLSGGWEPQDRYQRKDILTPGKQTITFVSEKGAEILVSDDETKHKTADGYTFRANYLNSPKNTGTSGNAFLLDAEGNSFARTTAATLNVKAFRPYFIEGTGVSNARRAKSTDAAVDKIIFGEDESKMGMVDLSDPRKGEVGQALYISAKENYIVVTSALNRDADIRIINTAGILMRKFTLEPGETREVRMNNGGVYIVKTADGRYRKKLAVK